jgi:hypothetical protein
MHRTRQNRQAQNPLPQYQGNNAQMVPPQVQRLTGNMGGRPGAIRESRMKECTVPQETRDSSLKFKIELDLEVEDVDLYARVKGDVTTGLM